MRLVVAGFAAASLAAAPTWATGQAARIGFISEPGAERSLPSAAAPLAPGEMQFEIQVTGKALSPPDQSLLIVNFSASGETAASARAAGQAVRQRLVDIARGLGAQPAAVSNASGFPLEVFGFGGDEIMVMPAGSADDDTHTANGFTARGGTELRLSDGQGIGDLRRALEQGGALSIMGPIYLLNDDTEARRRARDDALARAREEADRFASSQHMRVSRLVSFSESSNDSASMQSLFSQLSGRSAPTQPQVETRLSARVAFALVAQ